MPITYACICPRPPLRDADAATALQSVAEELAAQRPETAIVIGSPTGRPLDTIGIVASGKTNDDVTFETDEALADRVLEEARDVARIAWLRRMDDAVDVAALYPLRDTLEHARIVAIGASRLAPHVHFEFGRAIARATADGERRVALICVTGLSSAPRDEAAGRMFNQHYRRAVEEWDVKWMTGVDTSLRYSAAEDAVAQTAVLMGALSASRVEPRVLSPNAGQLVAAIDVPGPRRRAKKTANAADA